MDYLAIIIITFFSGVIGTGIGGLIGAILRKDSNKVVSLLLSFAGGVMLSVVTFDLMVEPLKNYEGENEIIIIIILTALVVIAGYLIIWGLNIWIDKTTNKEIPHIDNEHPKTADDLDELIHADHFESHVKNNQNLFIAGLIMMLAIALHNLPEGMVIGASYAKEEDLIANIFSGSGFLIALVIALHNIPEGMAVSVPLISGGMKKLKAIFLTALSGLPTVIGAVLGYLLGGLGEVSLLISLGFASGAMLYVIFGELLPESILMWKSKLPALALFVGVILGFILVFI
ncbi:ZIP family metal transporter [bacterium]|nr:ZIP family metal transporter [bacterium]